MKFLRTEYAALAGILLILLATVKHAFEVYTSVMYIDTAPDLYQQIYIAIMLIAIDFAVLLFTIHGNNYAAQTFAFMIFLVNLYAFWYPVTWPGWDVGLFIYTPGLLFSAMFAYGLFYFTELFSDLLRSRSIIGEWQEKYQEAQKEIANLKHKIESLNLEKKQLIEESQNRIVSNDREMEISPDLEEKVENYDLLLRYLLEIEGFDQKSPQAIKKGVEYWMRKAQAEELDHKGRIKSLLYRTAINLV